jgi:murein DD-endopeptidase MepM/ murein hydrolase activator NlpD
VAPAAVEAGSDAGFVDLLGQTAQATESGSAAATAVTTLADAAPRVYRVREVGTGREVFVVKTSYCMFMIATLSSGNPLAWVPLGMVAQAITSYESQLASGQQVVIHDGRILPVVPRQEGAAASATPAPAPAPAAASGAQSFNANLPVDHARCGSNFGPRFSQRKQKMTHHNGIDLPTATGHPIRASGPGKVVFAGNNGAYGNLVKLQHPDGTETWYAHASKLLVKEGDQVAAGQEIAKIGNTGNSDCPHLHFEVRRNGKPEDPRLYFKFPPKGQSF